MKRPKGVHQLTSLVVFSNLTPDAKLANLANGSTLGSAMPTRRPDVLSVEAKSTERLTANSKPGQSNLVSHLAQGEEVVDVKAGTDLNLQCLRQHPLEEKQVQQPPR